MAQTQSNINIFSSVDDMISSLRSLIFSFDYPVYSESWKHQLETEILQYYFQYEISISPFALWQMKLKNKLSLIMPYYNKLYESTQRQFDYLKSVDLETNTSDKETSSQQEISTNQVKNEDERNINSSSNSNNNNTSTSSSKGSNTGTENGVNKNSDTSSSTNTEKVSGTNQSVTNTNESSSDVTANVPQLYSENYDFDSQKGIKNGTGSATTNSTIGNNTQGSVSNSSTKENTTSSNSSQSNENSSNSSNTTIGSNVASEINKNSMSENSSGSNSTNAQKENNLNSKTQGFQGSYSKAILEYRETLIKLDELIIKELADLFFFVCDC